MNASPPAAEVRLVRVRVPLRVEHRAAHGTEQVRDVVLVRWTSADGVEGWGECPTLSAAGYATETTEAAWQALVDLLVPAALHGEAGVHPSLPAASGALLDAALDAGLRFEGVSLVEHLGGARRSLPRCEVVAALGSPADHVVRRARAAIDGGARMVKVKIAPARSVDVLRAVVEAVGADRVAADANGSYGSPDELAGIDALGLRYLEQPFPASLGLGRLAELHGSLRTATALDESITSVDAAVEAVERGAAKVLSVKPARVGGVEAAAAVVHVAASAGVDAFVGGMLELGIGRAAAAAVAAMDGCTLPTDLGPSSRYVERDVCDPIEGDSHGDLLVPTGPGIGRAPDEEVLARVAVQDERITTR